jgi:HEAT repeat protein
MVPINEKQAAFGTGSLIDKKNRLVLTNYHVVHDAATAATLFPLYEGGRLVQDRERYRQILRTNRSAVLTGQVVARNKSVDLALVQLPSVPANVLPLAVASKDVGPGDNVHSVGNPGSGGFLWVYAPGRVRSLALKHKWAAGSKDNPKDVLHLESDVLLTDSPTNPGDSGGPLVNDRAEMVGVTHGGDPSSRGHSLFINRSEVIRFVEDYCSKAGVTWDKTDRKLKGTQTEPTESDLPALVKELSNSESPVRARAAQVLGTMGAKAKLAVPDLARLLKDSEALPQRCALEALGKIGPDASPAADALVELLKGSDATTRKEAARTLGKIGAAVKGQAFPALTVLLKDSNKGLREVAAEAIASLGTLDPADLPVVLELSKDSDVEVRAFALRSLGHFPTQAKEVVPALVAAYKGSDDKRVQAAAVASLGGYPAEAATIVPIVTEALKSASPELMLAGSQAAANLGPEAAKLVPELASALENGDSATRKEVLTALKAVGPAAKAAVPAVAKVLADNKDHDMRLTALGVMEAAVKEAKDGKAAAPALIALFGEEPEQTNRILAVLAKVGGDALPALKANIANANKDVRLGVARALGALGRLARTAAPAIALRAQAETDPKVHEALLQAYQSVR